MSLCPNCGAAASSKAHAVNPESIEVSVRPLHSGIAELVLLDEVRKLIRAHSWRIIKCSKCEYVWASHGVLESKTDG